MSDDFKTFRSHFGLAPPAALVAFLGNESIRRSLPIVFHFRNLPFILEIQYLLSLEDERNYDVQHKRISFAVNTDGFRLLVDLATERLDIMQDEFGDCDSLGLTFQDLLAAEWSAIK